MQKKYMATDYYIVGNLRKDYEETYSKLGHRWKDYAERKYDIMIRCRRTDFYWRASILRLMKALKVRSYALTVNTPTNIP